MTESVLEPHCETACCPCATEVKKGALWSCVPANKHDFRVPMGIAKQTHCPSSLRQWIVPTLALKVNRALSLCLLVAQMLLSDSQSGQSASQSSVTGLSEVLWANIYWLHPLCVCVCVFQKRPSFCWSCRTGEGSSWRGRRGWWPRCRLLAVPMSLSYLWCWTTPTQG